MSSHPLVFDLKYRKFSIENVDLYQEILTSRKFDRYFCFEPGISKNFQIIKLKRASAKVSRWAFSESRVMKHGE